MSMAAFNTGGLCHARFSCGRHLSLSASSHAHAFPGFRRAYYMSVRRRPTLEVVSAAKGAQTPQPGTSGDNVMESVEMFVAHDDDMGLLSRAKEMARRIVPKPRNGNAAPNTVASNEGSTPPAPVEAPSLNASLEKVNGQASAMASMAQKRARALQAELGIVSAELREKTMEVKQSQKVIRQKDSEIAGLKGMLQQKEMQVVAARSELVDARVQIQEKDTALQSALEQLTSAAKERSQLRKDLIGAQTELMETRSEIERWTIHLNQLKAVMESVDVDEIEGSAMQEMAVEGLAELDAEQMIDDQYFDMLMDLNDLASSLAKEAAEDEETFRNLNQQMDGHA